MAALWKHLSPVFPSCCGCARPSQQYFPVFVAVASDQYVTCISPLFSPIIHLYFQLLWLWPSSSAGLPSTGELLTHQLELLPIWRLTSKSVYVVNDVGWVMGAKTFVINFRGLFCSWAFRKKSNANCFPSWHYKHLMRSWFDRFLQFQHATVTSVHLYFTCKYHWIIARNG